jgi:hypothetical protein
MIILGAGLAGCIAAHLFPGSRILEAGPASAVGGHKALLRFRSDALSKITGIPFRRVHVQKNVLTPTDEWSGGQTPPVGVLNCYSRKVSGGLSDRSIADTRTVERWIAPDDFHAQLVKRLPIEFGAPVSRISKLAIWAAGETSGIDRTEEPILSTIPLPSALGATGIMKEYLDRVSFVRASIVVTRVRVRNCDLFQTVYFPHPLLRVYRASITGNLLIVESVAALTPEDWGAVHTAFALTPNDYASDEPPEPFKQQYGKIVPLGDDVRRAILLRLTREFGVYSFGRFACWRNLLLDDLVTDAERISALIRMGDYERELTGVTT